MDIHTRVVAMLHIVSGAFAVVIPLVFGLAFGGLAGFMPDIEIPGFVVSLGAFFLGIIVLLGLVEAAAGVALWKGSRNARVIIIACGALCLFSFPVGTLLGIYTLWTLLRKQPVPDAA